LCFKNFLKFRNKTSKRIKMKNFIRILLIIVCVTILITCKKSEKSNEIDNVLKTDEVYADIDLFTFKPISFKEKNSKSFLTLEEDDNKKIITVYHNNFKNTKTYTKNKKGYYTEVVQTNTEEQNPGFITMFYIVYSKDRIVYFKLHKKGKGQMKLTGYDVILPIDDNIQKVLSYTVDNFKITSFEEIDNLDILEEDISSNFSSQIIYKFNFKKNNASKYYSLQDIKNKPDQVYDIINSKSVASPWKNYWILLHHRK